MSDEATTRLIAGAMSGTSADGVDVAITRVTLAADLPTEARPAYEWLRPESASFAQWLHLKANRHDDFYQRPAGAIDLCNALPPVRAVKPAPGGVKGR